MLLICNVCACTLIKYKLHFDPSRGFYFATKALSTPLPCIMIIVLLEPAFLFFVLTSGRPFNTGNNILCLFEATLQPLCSADRDSGIFCTAAKALFIAVKGLSTAAKICGCCFYSSFVALLEAILQRCSSTARLLAAAFTALL